MGLDLYGANPRTLNDRAGIVMEALLDNGRPITPAGFQQITCKLISSTLNEAFTTAGEAIQYVVNLRMQYHLVPSDY